MKARKIISVFAALGIILSIWVSPKATAENSYAPRDIDSHWAEEEISTLMYADILRGDNGSANPNSTITRGEFTALITRTLSLDYENKVSFSDIPQNHMFFEEISAAANAGLVNGVGGSLFMSQNTITREEIMLIIARCLPDSHSAKTSFKDIGSGYAYRQELGIAVASGIITGFTDNTFRPKSNASRAECAVMLTRLLKAQDDIPKADALELSLRYIQNEMENTGKNAELSTGRSLEEVNMKLVTQKNISSASTQIEKLSGDLKLEEYTSDGHLATIVYTGDITYVTTNKNGTRNKAHTAIHKINIIQKDDMLYVYNYDLSLKSKQRINLTWEVYSTPPDTAPQGINVISPSSFQISAENLGVEKKALPIKASFYNSLTRKYMSWARENGYDVWPIYKTDFSLSTSDSFLNNYTARQTAVKYLTDYACEYLIDGINIDFENVYERNRHLVTKHARELAIAMHELGLIVSVDITRKEPTSANWSMCYNRDALSDNTDYIMLMAYDEYYASSKTAGSVASLDWTRQSIERTLSEVPAAKLVLGIPFYMRYFETQNGKVTSTKAISMQTAYELINSNDVTYTYMEDDQQYKISWQKNGKNCVFWLENTDTIAKRVSLANEYSLAGVASWRRGLEISKVWEIISRKL